MDLVLVFLVASAGLAFFLNIFLERFRLPTILGYVAAGAVVSNLADLRSHDLHALYEVAEFGIVFLMFTIGLEFSFRHLKAMKFQVFVLGLLQVAATTLLFFAIGHLLLGLDPRPALVVAAALALSSTAIVLKLLGESGHASAPFGRNAVGILLFQDLAVIPILMMITFFTEADASVGALLLKTAAGAAAVLAILLFAGKYLLNRFLKMAASSGNEELFLLAVLLIVFAASLLVHVFGFSYTLGAFASGLMIAETRYKFQVEADLAPFRNLLLGVFFVTVGMQVSFPFLAANALTVAGAALGIMALKALAIFAVVRVFAPTAVAGRTALALAQVGEFAFAVLELSRNSGLIGSEVNQTLIAATVVSMVATPFLIQRAFAWKEKELEAGIFRQPGEGNGSPVLVIGYGQMGRETCRLLEEQGLDRVVVERSHKAMELAEKNGETVVFGDGANREILEAAGVKEALAVLVTLEDAHHAGRVGKLAEELNPFATLTLYAADAPAGEHLARVRTAKVVVGKETAARQLVAVSLRCELG